MGIDQRPFRRCPDRPSLSDEDVRTQVDRTMNMVREIPDDYSGGDGEAGCATDLSTHPGTVRPVEQWVSATQVHRELAACERRAQEERDPESARRAAELYEALHDFARAADWWRAAAELGDQDAIDHLRYILR